MGSFARKKRSAGVRLTSSMVGKEMDSRLGGGPESDSRLGRAPLPRSISGEGQPPRLSTPPPGEVASIPPPPLCSDPNAREEEAEGNTSKVFPV
jgi:hypothetical protein